MCHLHNSIRPGISSNILSHQFHDSFCLECVELRIFDSGYSFWSSELTSSTWEWMHVDKLCDLGHGILDQCTSFILSTLVNVSYAVKLARSNN